MTFSIAVAGKGGTGKTSLTSLLIRYLKQSGSGPILAVDADANANLGESLGLSVEKTIGSVIAGFNEEKINIPPGMTKEAYLEVKLSEVIVESQGLDLITMGRGEGPDCYCYPNLLLRKFIDRLAANYAYIVMDNEAGMEHLSRRTTRDIDALLLISNHSVKGVRTIARIRDLVTELKLNVKRQWVIINAVPGKLDPVISEEVARLGIDSVATVPFDEAIHDYDLKVRPLVELPDTSEAVQAVNDIMDNVLNKQGLHSAGSA
ncbi:MAG: AAA family ATPase [Chloroflexota bacterium]